VFLIVALKHNAVSTKERVSRASMILSLRRIDPFIPCHALISPCLLNRLSKKQFACHGYRKKGLCSTFMNSQGL